MIKAAFFSFFLLAILSANYGEVSAAGIGLSPAELAFSIDKSSGKGSERNELTIYNLAKEDVWVSAKSPALPAFLSLPEPKRIAGEGNERISIDVFADNLKEGTYEEVVVISAASAATNTSGVSIATGISVPLRITVFSSRPAARIAVGLLISLGIVVLGIGIFSGIDAWYAYTNKPEGRLHR